MKNYPHLYNQFNKKLSTKITKSPIKSVNNSQLLTTKASVKTIGIYNSHLNNQKKHVSRGLARSIEQLRYNYEAESEQPLKYNSIGSSLQDQELFSRSYSKIDMIKQTFPYKSIDKELNEILALIKQQKSKISHQMKALKTTNDEYRKISEGYFRNKVDCCVNTEDILYSMNEKICCDQMVECHLMQEGKTDGNEVSGQTAAESASVVNKQAYLKLRKMLQEMNINAQDILPCQQRIHEQIYISDYKCLSDKQIIKIQKFFIKKLIQKMPK